MNEKVTLMFAFLNGIRVHSGFRHGPGETGKTLQKAVFMLLFPKEIQGNSGNKVKKREFL